MGEPVVIQGTAVGGPSGAGPQDSSYDQNFVKGEKQESKCRDPIFSFLFYGNIIAIIVVVIMFGDAAFQAVDETTSDLNYLGFLYAVLICGIFAMILSGVMLLVMMRIPTILIKTSLIFVVVMSLVWAIAGFIMKNWWVGIFGLIFFFIGMCYARAVWSRIPFATANLLTGCTAIRSNCGLIFMSFLFVAIAFGWSVLWVLAFAGTFDSTYNCNEQNGCTSVNYGYLFLLFLSYFFTHQVISNTVHVIVAGTVGVWWFSPEDAGCCSAAVLGSTIRYDRSIVFNCIRCIHVSLTVFLFTVP